MSINKIMELTKQVTSLELSKKLKELGVKQESIFVYDSVDGDNPYSKIILKKGITISQDISAFTVAELGELLPDRVHTPEANNYAPAGTVNELENFGKNVYGKYIVSYHHPFKVPLITFMEDTEADARAKMLIYLLENHLIEL